MRPADRLRVVFGERIDVDEAIRHCEETRTAASTTRAGPAERERIDSIRGTITETFHRRSFYFTVKQLRIPHSICYSRFTIPQSGCRRMLLDLVPPRIIA